MSEWEAIEIDFRGEKRTVDFEYEGDDIIVWGFSDCDICCQTPEGDITQAESDSVHEEIWAILEDRWAPRPEDDL